MFLSEETVREIISEMRSSGKLSYDEPYDNPIILINRYENEEDLAININGLEKRVHIDGRVRGNIREIFEFIDEAKVKLSDERLMDIGMAVIHMWDTIVDNMKTFLKKMEERLEREFPD